MRNNNLINIILLMYNLYNLNKYYIMCPLKMNNMNKKNNSIQTQNNLKIMNKNNNNNINNNNFNNKTTIQFNKISINNNINLIFLNKNQQVLLIRTKIIN